MLGNKKFAQDLSKDSKSCVVDDFKEVVFSRYSRTDTQWATKIMTAGTIPI